MVLMFSIFHPACLNVLGNQFVGSLSKEKRRRSVENGAQQQTASSTIQRDASIDSCL